MYLLNGLDISALMCWWIMRSIYETPFNLGIFRKNEGKSDKDGTMGFVHLSQLSLFIFSNTTTDSKCLITMEPSSFITAVW